jgi:hypothetical protein
MGELDRGRTRNINVTLGQQGQGSTWEGKVFPCCVCSADLDIRRSKRAKPYCTCVQCGIQIFFRGKMGILRLIEILDSGNLSQGTTIDTVPAITLYNRILRMRSQRKKLQEKQGLIIQDPDLENAIHVVDNEIKYAQGELRQLSRKHRPEKIK